MTLFAMVACSDPPTATDYDQTCSADADCVAVRSGCDDGCQCPDSAINAKDLTQFQKDHDGCKPTIGCECIQSHVSCTSGKCTFDPGPA
jgi:hypothetical protein